MNIFDYDGEKLWYHEILKQEFEYLTKLLAKHNITYWIDWGTLIGALRNGCIILFNFILRI